MSRTCDLFAESAKNSSFHRRPACMPRSAWRAASATLNLGEEGGQEHGKVRFDPSHRAQPRAVRECAQLRPIGPTGCSLLGISCGPVDLRVQVNGPWSWKRSAAFGAAQAVGVWIGAKIATESFRLSLATLVIWIATVLVIFGVLDRRR